MKSCAMRLCPDFQREHEVLANENYSRRCEGDGPGLPSYPIGPVAESSSNHIGSGGIVLEVLVGNGGGVQPV